MSESENHFSAEKVAKLARLHLSSDELVEVQKQIQNILNFVEQIDGADLGQVEPFFGATANLDPIREDQVIASVDRQAITTNAPDFDGEFYRVPPVFKK